ncbi:MAG: exo-alpha-sialidase, partial [Chitinispirillia bacterium]
MSQFFKVIVTCCITVGMMMTTANAKPKVSGKILDLKGSPISGATVKLIKSGQSTVSGDDGSFSFTGNTAITPSLDGGIAQPQFAALRNGCLEITASKRTVASITGFNLSGKVVYHKKRIVEAGMHAFPISDMKHGLMLFRVQADGRTVNLKAYSIGGVIQGTLKNEKRAVALRAVAQQDKKVTGVPPILDTLIVTKSGYLDYDMQICKDEVSGLSLRMASEDQQVWSRNNCTGIKNSVHAASILQLHDGTLLVVYFGGSREGAQDTQIWLSRKNPGSDKWEDPVVAASGKREGKKYGVGNPSLFLSRSGKIILLFKLLRKDINNRWGYMTTSLDGGKTWTPQRDLCKGCMGTEKNKPLQLADGRILAPKSDRTKVQNGGVGFEVSYDDGETWEFQNLAPKNGSIQPAILELPDGSLRLYTRTKGGLMPTITTSDYGKTWGKWERSVMPSTGCGFDGLTLRDGRHILVYNHHHSSGKGPRQFLVMAMSKNAVDWSAAQVVSNASRGGQFSYAAVIQGNDGLLYIAFTWHRKKIGHVVINPYKITDETLVPMPDGRWPTSGPLSKGANKDQ